MAATVVGVAISIETLRNGDEAASYNLASLVFGDTKQYDPSAVRLPNDRIIGAYEGDTILGTLSIHDYSQWLGGCSVSMGGIGDVAVTPQARGKGIAGRLLTESLHRMVDMGHAISVLYPSTATLYRSYGWEFTGLYSWAQIAAVDADLEGSPNVVKLDQHDSRLRPLYDQAAMRHNGWLDRNDYQWESIWHSFKNTPMPSSLYGIERGDELVAVVGYCYSKPSNEPFDLNVRLCFALDGAALADALTFLSRHNTMASKIELLYPAHELQLSIAHGQRLIEHRHEPWMLRLVDTTAAIAARGFPSGLDATIELNVFDEQLERNAGRFVLTVRGGSGSLEPGGSGEVSIDVTDFAALYSGFADAGFLANAGRLAGAERDDIEALRLAFCGPNPTLVNYF